MAEDLGSSGKRVRVRTPLTGALKAPLNIAVGLGIVAVGFIFGAPPALIVALAAVVYGASVVLTPRHYEAADRGPVEDGGEPPAADRHEPREVSLDELDADIRARVEAVRRRETQLRRAIAAEDLPYTELGSEVGAFVAEAERSARGAQLLSKHEEALRDRPEVAERVEYQLAGYHAEMERLCGELDSVRVELISAPEPTDPGAQGKLAAAVRGLRDEMSAVAAALESASRGVAEMT
jgi:hypothetical protein